MLFPKLLSCTIAAFSNPEEFQAVTSVLSQTTWIAMVPIFGSQWYAGFTRVDTFVQMWEPHPPPNGFDLVNPKGAVFSDVTGKLYVAPISEEHDYLCVEKP